MTRLESFITADLIATDEQILQRAGEAMTRALQDKKREAAAVREAWMQMRQQSMQSRTSAAPTALRETLDRAARKLELAGDFEIQVIEKGKKETSIFTVRHILDDREKFNGCQTLDPLEPEYNSSSVVGKLFLKSATPTLHSLAHGGMTYRLFSSADEPNVCRKRLIWNERNPSEIVLRCINQMKATERFFCMGEAAALLRNNRVSILTEPLLDFEISRHVDLMTQNAEGEYKAKQMPIRQIKQILDLVPSELKPLESIIDYPLPDEDGILPEMPGYIDKAGLFLTKDPALFDVPKVPSEEDLRKAVETCFLPFTHFQFENHTQGRSAVLAAVMTSVLRPAVPVAPVIAITSPSLGAGKSYLATALGAIATGEVPDCQSLPETSVELEKVLFSHLMQGSRFVHFDNADQNVQSSVLSSYATAARISGRILGVSKINKHLPNRALLVINGRNLSFGNGMARRHIPIRLKPSSTADLTKAYDFIPQDLALQLRHDIITAVLTLTRAAKAVCVSRRNFASYEQWSRLVRDPLAAIAELMPDLDLVDPLAFLQSGMAADTHVEHTGELLSFLQAHFQGEEFTSADVRERCLGDRAWDDLVRTVFPSGSGRTAQGIGIVLSRLLDQPAQDRVLRRRMRDGKNMWLIEMLKPSD